MAMTGPPAEKAAGPGVMRAHLDDLGQARQQRPQPGGDAAEVTLDEQQLGTGIAENVIYLARGQPPVDRHQDRAGLGAAKREVVVVLRFLAEVGNPRPGGQPLGEQGVPGLVAAPVQLGVADLAVLADDGHMIRALAGMYRGPPLACLLIRIVHDVWSFPGSGGAGPCLRVPLLRSAHAQPAFSGTSCCSRNSVSCWADG